jgi:hypothetical protein
MDEQPLHESNALIFSLFQYVCPTEHALLISSNLLVPKFPSTNVNSFVKLLLTSSTHFALHSGRS